jgi:YHS domain-containing protein
MKFKLIGLSALATLAAGLLAAVAAYAADEGAKPAAKSEVTKPFFGNANCPMTGKAVDKAVFAEKNGERIYFCCNGCKGKGVADFEGTLPKAYPADKVVDTKNAMCPIMGEAIDPEQTLVLQGHKVAVCCKGCDKKLRKSTNHFLALIADPALVPLKNKKCLVSGSDSTGTNIYVYEGVLVDACSDKCSAAFEKDPAKYLTAAGVDLAKVKAEAKPRAEQPAAGGEKKSG